MNTIKLLLSTTLVTFLVGCETMQSKTQAQLRTENHNAMMMKADNKLKSCLASRDKTSLKYVANNIRALEGISENRYELLQSERFYAEVDKAPLLKYLNESSSCGNAFIDDVYSIDYKMSLNMKNASALVDKQFIKFMKGEINVSQLNLSIEEIKRIGETNDQIIVNDQDRKAEIAHNKEVDRNLEAYKAEQQAAANKPVTNWGQIYMDLAKESAKKQYDLGGTTTNCQVNGNTVNCQSY